MSYPTWADLVDLPLIDDDTEGILGDGFATVLESYLVMYETTGDRAYLHRFMGEAMKVLNYRWDLCGVLTQQSYWSHSAYHNANISAALARYVHFMDEHPEIAGEQFYPFPEIVDPWFYWDGTTPYACQTAAFGGCDTYGEFSDWLAYRANETIQNMFDQGYWIEGDGLAKDPGGDRVAAFNLQSGFTRSLVYLGLHNPGPWMLGKAGQVANAAKSYLVLHNACQGDYADYVLKNQSGNATWWYHNGWRVTTVLCWVNQRADVDAYTSIKEDISHGATVMYLLRDLHDLLPGTPVVANDMVRLRNTFTKHLYDPSTGGFSLALDGTNGPITGTPHLYAPLAWAYLHRYDGFDETSPDIVGVLDDVYEILMHFGEEQGMWDPGSSSFNLTQYSGQEILGHADLTAAQWERECFDLSLFNRDLVHDQNFAAKRVLTIAPSGGPGPSFAYPVITEQRFTINENVRSALRGGSAVVLEPGFEAVYGSISEITIDPLGCAMEVKRAGGHGGRSRAQEAMQEAATRNASVGTEVTSTKAGSVLQVAPNPSDGRVRISLPGTDADWLQWCLRDAAGRPVLWGTDRAGRDLSSGFVIDGTSLSVGTYFLEVVGASGMLTARVVFTE